MYVDAMRECSTLFICTIVHCTLYSSWSGAVSVGEVPGSLNKCFYVVVPAHARLHNERGGNTVPGSLKKF